MLEKIEYIFQKNAKNLELFNMFINLFKDVKYVTNINNEEIHIITSNLKPETIFKLDNITSNIQLNIGNNKYLNLLSRQNKDNKKLCHTKKLHINYVYNKLLGHIKRIDHTGINLPTVLFDELEYKNLLNYLSFNGNVYSYPTGEPWPFLLPTTKYEHENEISNFKILREPRFEFVYDKYTNIVGIQIDIETDLSQDEIEDLFPKDQGVYYDGCTFKSIYLDYSENLDIRLDVRYKSNYGDWESGKWLVYEGKRI